MNKKKNPIEKFEPFNIIVFGGGGDLAMRKIYPALFHRYLDGQFGDAFNIIAVTRKDKEDFPFQDELKKFIKESMKDATNINLEIENFARKIKLMVIQNPTVENYKELADFLNSFKNYQNIFYYSTPSSAFGSISKTLKESNLVHESSKVVLEKPLGNSLETSNQINAEVTLAFNENQIYRIDHYLGKETVQNLMVLRFANNLFEKAWNGENIDNVQITVAEHLGVENRVGYYDNSGALLDMIQNHLLQLLCLVAMEPPNVLEANEVRIEKLKVLNSLRPFTKKTVLTDTVKGQYTRGVINGEEVKSYLEGIEKYDSKTETYVAIKTFVDNWRWKNVPFYLRTGKRMKKRYSEIVINFKTVKHNIFQTQEKMPHNKLIINLQPDETIELVQMTKIPGPGGYRYQPIALKLDYSDTFKDRFPEAYERLLIDVIRGNQTLFMSQEELQAAWKWTEAISTSWIEANQQNILYEAGTWGPTDKIMEGDDNWETKL
ncbi:MAG: glucose-6-phosphate dehydrogenase [Chitinophagaceae bacterium]|nr:glucose-6-phosphate dehydrogenase [Chitinophagaceae bacterium]